MRSLLWRLRLALVGMVLGAFSLIAGAQTVWNGTTAIQLSSGPGVLYGSPAPSAAMQWMAAGAKTTATSGGPLRELAPLKLPFNPSPTATFKAAFTPTNMAKAIFNPTSLLLAYAAGEALDSLLTQACVRLAGGSMQINPQSGWEECHYSDVTTSGYQWKGPYTGVSDTSPFYSTNTAACTANVAAGSGSDGFPWGNARMRSTATMEVKCDYDVYYPSQVGGGSLTLQYAYKTWTEHKFDGYVGTDAAKAQAAVKTKLDEWTQCDFLYGYGSCKTKNAATTSEILDKLMGTGNGVAVDPGGVTATGPASITGSPETTTTQNPDGTTSTTTKTPTYNYTYNAGSDNRVTITQTTTYVTNNSTVNNSTNQVLQTSTSTTTKTEDPQDTSFADTPLPNVPELYKQKYPDGLKGVWNTAKAQIDATPLGQLRTQLMPTIGDGGTCPHITLPLDFAPWASFGTADVSPDCSIWAFGKVVVLVSALLLARALIFGG